MPRSKLTLWILIALAVIVPTALAIVLIQAGGFAGIALLALLVGAFVVARIAFPYLFFISLVSLQSGMLNAL